MGKKRQPGFRKPRSVGKITGKSTGRVENLRRPWAKGESGNPKGRPKGSGVKDIALAFNALLSQFVDRDEKVRRVDVLFWDLVRQAKNGNSAAARTILGWGLGMPKQMIQVTQGVDIEIKVAEELEGVDLKASDNVVLDEAKDVD